jgi:hypothetical protein
MVVTGGARELLADTSVVIGVLVQPTSDSTSSMTASKPAPALNKLFGTV